MKRLHLLQFVVAGFAVGGLSGLGRAAEEPKPEVAKRPLLERMLKEFDRDGSGRLNAEELSAARRAMEQALAQISEKEEGAPREVASIKGSNTTGSSAEAGRPNLMAVLKRFDKDGDGKLSNEEKAAALKPREGQGLGMPGRPNIQEMVARFDKDGDGKLNDEEQAAARAAFEQRRGGGAAGGGLIPGKGKQSEAKVDTQELLKKFDKDGDGKLDDDEKAAARKEFQKRESPAKE